MALATREQHVADLVASRRDDLVSLLQHLIAYDTTTPTGGEEAALQSFLGERLARAGATIDLREPEPSLVAGHPYIPDGFSFAGRPHHCVLPWSAVYAVVSEADQRGMVWPDDVPAEALADDDIEPDEATPPPSGKRDHLKLVD